MGRHTPAQKRFLESLSADGCAHMWAECSPEEWRTAHSLLIRGEIEIANYEAVREARETPRSQWSQAIVQSAGYFEARIKQPEAPTMYEFVFQIDDVQDGEEFDSGLPYLVQIEEDDEQKALQVARAAYIKVFGEPEAGFTLQSRRMDTTITEGMVKSCQTELAGRSIVISAEEVRRIIAANASLREKLVGWYGESTGQGLDTGERDLLFDGFAVTTLGFEGGWPYNMDRGTKLEADFIAAVRKAVAEGKIEIEKEAA